MSVALRCGGEGRWLSGLVLLVTVASFAALILGTAAGVPVGEVYGGYAAAILILGLVGFVIAAGCVVIGAVVRRTPEPLRECQAFFTERMGSPDRAIGTLGPILLMPLLMGAFGTLKQIMPLFAPFAWDDTVAEMGRIMFLGHRPWQLTHALFGPMATMILGQIYAAWVPILFVAVLGMALLAKPYLRARFFVTFASAWLLLGVIAAFLLSSAGPCFAALVGADSAEAFRPLMERLHGMKAAGYPVSSLDFQEMLWRAQLEHHYGFALGISAMPSMHNSIAFLYALCARTARPALRIGAYLFAAAILVGSVHLGWHYLADGLIAWAGTAAIWWASSAYLRWCGFAPEEMAAETQQTVAKPVGDALPA